MTQTPHDSKELEKIYGRRFDEHILYRDQIWKLLTSEFFSKYVSPGPARNFSGQSIGRI